MREPDFIAAICAAPDDDGPRLVYADWLLERSDPRGELIQLDCLIHALAASRPNLVFMLWGSHAQAKKPLLGEGHRVLEAPHPSPLSAHRGFLGCGHFREANRWLEAHGRTPVDWTAA